jgi:TetR/AcrR family fatty acid metabolism transcriptional regulator
MGFTASRRQVNRLPPEKRIADIMGAARLVFAEKGYENALITEIAERAGLVEGSIYRFFANKRELLIKVVEYWFEELLRDEDEHIPAIRGTWNRIRYVVRRHLQAIHDEPGLARLVFQELRPDPGYRATHVFELNRAYVGRMMEVVKEAMTSGEFRSDISTTLVRDMIYGCAEHHTWAFLRGEGDFSVDKTADGITEIIYRGLAAAPPAQDPLGQNVARLEKIATQLESLATKARPE